MCLDDTCITSLEKEMLCLEEEKKLFKAFLRDSRGILLLK